ncbi:hypothetical protein [Nocardioides sp.]|uniref:hypothetical protein n=1 Tax=Nocardioides sp. TaxID=35761 RepID=UPI0035697BB5
MLVTPVRPVGTPPLVRDAAGHRFMEHGAVAEGRPQDASLGQVVPSLEGGVTLRVPQAEDSVEVDQQALAHAGDLS